MLINDANLELVAKGFKSIYNTAFDSTVSHRDTVAMTVQSQSAEENYGWLGQFPELREWVGDRHIHQLASHGFAIRNKIFESTVKVQRVDIEDDKYGVYKPMFSEMGRVSKQHPDTMIFGLLKDGFNVTCYDGQNFFDEDHPGVDPSFTDQPGSVSNVQAGSGPAWFLLDLSKAVKPIIWQERIPYEFQTITDPKDTKVFMTDEFLYGIRARVNAGFGLWQLAFSSKDTLNKTNYAAARQAMAKFAGDRGQPLGIMPTHLVVPSTLEGVARELLLSDQIEGSSNIWKGTADLIVTPWLG
jgi:phage major head subunit gpT-like protein